MFGGKKDKSNQFAAGGHTLFDHAVEIHGSVRFGGTLDVEGTVVGDIVADDASDALVRIRDKGVVQGEISSPKVMINGHVTGNVHASKHLELAANAIVNGDVHYQIIEMVKGAQVNGNLVHISEVKEKEKETTKPNQQAQNTSPSPKNKAARAATPSA